MRIGKGFMTRAGLGLAAALAFAVPSTAMAQRTYDVVSDFGESRFSYGTGNGANGTFTPAPFTASGCFGQASFSCYAADAQTVPTVTRNNSAGSVSIGTPLIPNDVLFLHPGTATDAIVRFTATFASMYSVSANFIRLDTTSGTDNGNNGVIASVFRSGSAVAVFDPTVLPSTAAYGASVGFSNFNVALAAGETLSFVVNNRGDYNYDSTGLQAVITAVPEASTWAMMLVGFGMVGGALRRRRKVTGQAALA